MSMIEQNIAACESLIEKAENLGETGDTQDLYYLIGYLVSFIHSNYPQIPCQAGCSQCCVDNGLPRTTALEWEKIEALLPTLPPETLAKIKAQNEGLHGQQQDILRQERARLEAPDQHLPMPPFQETKCPFLIDSMCSIYEARPAICRGYGYFSFRPPAPADPQIFACRMAGEALIYTERDRGNEKVALPVWNKVMNRVYALNQGQKIDTLPMWLFDHFDGSPDE